MTNKEKKEKKNEKRPSTVSIRMMNTHLEHARREKTLVRIYRMCNTSLEGRRHIGREGLGPYEGWECCEIYGW
jgi:CRISPR/Cas system-associated endoribonuclease Cas2